MKTLIILVLAGALVAGLFLSKPSQASFATYISSQTQTAQTNSIGDVGKKLLGNLMGNAQASILTYHDHIIWATEDLNGQPQYFGMFGHWWKQSSASTPATPAGS